MLPPIGLRVNGEDIGVRKSDGWFYDADGILTLSGLANYALEADSQEACENVRRMIVGGTTAISISNIVMTATIWRESPFTLESGANVELTLVGDNAFTGAGNAAGISMSPDTSLTIDGDGSLTATGGEYGAGIGGSFGVKGGNVTISSGTVTATGGDHAAGIGGGGKVSSGSAIAEHGGNVTITGGNVTARGGWHGAGIGGGYFGSGGTAVISGGVVTATGGGYGAGIGGGDYGDGGTIEISGGVVTATCGNGGAGIGGGFGGYGGTIEISGGTVHACGGYQDESVFAADIGDGLNYSTTASINNGAVITGGSVVPAHFDSEKARFTQSNCTVTNMAHDAAGRVLRAAVVHLWTPDAAVVISGIDGYGTRDLYADANGDLYLWLPDGDYSFTANGRGFTATVDGADTVAVADLALNALRIESVKLVPGAVDLVVSAEPAEWLTSETAQSLRVRASEELPLPGDDAALLPRTDVEATANGDGTATLTVPRAADVPRKFYRVEADP